MSIKEDKIQQRIIDLIDENRDEIIAFARDIYDHGELGYKEFKTSAKFSSFLEGLQLRTQKQLAITGVKGYLNEDRKETASLALIGELDALRIPNHNHSNPETDAAHCCGHHCQLAGVIGAALALTDKEVADALDGQVVFFAVPSEEYGEIEFKNKLKEEGKIRYGGGKSELIRLGAFDDIHLSIAHHTGLSPVSVGGGTGNGFVSKVIRYKGKAAHAAGAPHRGVNALNAAAVGLSALAYHRETFMDKDCVRIHPIITKGGNLVNVVPDEAVIETLVRASSIEAINDASIKTDRSFKAGALALGAKVEIETMPGYLPTLAQKANPEILAAAKLAAGDKYPVDEADTEFHSGGSTDLGDLEHVQPVISFRTGGMKDQLHSESFDILDEELAYIVTAKIFALSAYALLKNGAEEARKIIQEYKPVFSKDQYIEYMEGFICKEFYPQSKSRTDDAYLL